MKNILLIDDDKSEFLYFNFLLKDHYKDNFELNYAATIDEALYILSKKSINVILLDDRLSNGLTSVDTIPQLNRKAFNVPVVIVSKNTAAGHLKDRIKMGTHKVADKFNLKAQIAAGLLD